MKESILYPNFDVFGKSCPKSHCCSYCISPSLESTVNIGTFRKEFFSLLRGFFPLVYWYERVNFVPQFWCFWQKLPKISLLFILYQSLFGVNSQYRDFQKSIFLSPKRSLSASLLSIWKSQFCTPILMFFDKSYPKSHCFPYCISPSSGSTVNIGTFRK